MTRPFDAPALLQAMLKARLQDRGSQRLLADKCGVKPSVVSNWKHGRHSPPLEQLGTIARFCGFGSVSEMFATAGTDTASPDGRVPLEVQLAQEQQAHRRTLTVVEKLARRLLTLAATGRGAQDDSETRRVVSTKPVRRRDA